MSLLFVDLLYPHKQLFLHLQFNQLLFVLLSLTHSLSLDNLNGIERLIYTLLLRFELYFRLCLDDILKRLSVLLLNLGESLVLFTVGEERIVQRVLLDESIYLLLLLLLVDKCQCALICRFEAICLLSLLSFPSSVL